MISREKIAQLVIGRAACFGTSHVFSDEYGLSVTGVSNTRFPLHGVDNLLSIDNTIFPKVKDVFHYSDVVLLVEDYIKKSKSLNELELDKRETKKIALNIIESIESVHQTGSCLVTIRPELICVDDESVCNNLTIYPRFDRFRTIFHDHSRTLSRVLCFDSLYCPPEILQPEIINLKKVNTSSDIYSVGLTLIKLLTGKYIYQKKCLFETLKAYYSNEVGEWGDSWLSVKDVLLRTLSPNPIERPSLSEIKEAIIKAVP